MWEIISSDKGSFEGEKLKGLIKVVGRHYADSEMPVDVVAVRYAGEEREREFPHIVGTVVNEIETWKEHFQSEYESEEMHHEYLGGLIYERF